MHVFLLDIIPNSIKQRGRGRGGGGEGEIIIRDIENLGHRPSSTKVLQIVPPLSPSAVFFASRPSIRRARARARKKKRGK